MGSSDKEGAPKMEERMAGEESAIASTGERESAEAQVVGELSHAEKQQLFLKKLYRLSQTHIEETPEEHLAEHKVQRTIASPLTYPTRTEKEPIQSGTPPQSPAVSFATKLSEMTSCMTMDYLCTARECVSPKRQVKKKSPLLQKKPAIPETILLEPSPVSLLEDDDSLTRHINAIAQKAPPPQPVNVDDASKSSPQCVAELSYEMEISRIIPVVEHPKNKNLFPKANNDTSLMEGEMEF